MKLNIAVIKGDGIGPEIIDSTLLVLDKIAQLYSHQFEYKFVDAGGVSIDKHGVPLTDEALKACMDSDAVLLGAVGGVKWESLPGHLRPERALLGLRKELNLFANLRPAKLVPVLKDACPLREDIVDNGIDMIIVRELTGGIYFGKSGRDTQDGIESAYDTERYNEIEIERIATVAFNIARGRKKRVVSIDKANVLESSRLWREVVHRVAKNYPDITLSDMLVDNAAMQLIRNPAQFDVIVTSNIFGDILSDEASQLTGSIGLLASASLGEGTKGLYEPIHGSAPDIAGLNKANPIATILSSAMMLRHSFDLKEEALSIENAVDSVLNQGYATADIAFAKSKIVGSDEMTRQILDAIK